MTTCRSAPASERGSSVLASMPGGLSIALRQRTAFFPVTAIAKFLGILIAFSISTYSATNDDPPLCSSMQHESRTAQPLDPRFTRHDPHRHDAHFVPPHRQATQAASDANGGYRTVLSRSRLFE